MAENKNIIEQKEEEYGNNPELEMNWAITAYKFAEVHFKLITFVPDLTTIRLTRFDDELYSFFRLTFPTLQVDLISEDEIKSPEQKEIWRPFLMNWERKIEDFNFGTLLRLDSAKEYTPDNTCVVPRTQFYCFEIARNRENKNFKKI